MADSGRVCVYSGAVVHGKVAVPDDPSDYSPADGWGSAGCNRLRCVACGAMVRNRAYVEATEDVSDRLDELYAADDWLSLPYIEESGSWRLYACRCTVFIAGRSHVMDDPEHDPLTDESFPWRCAGHPEPSLPLTVDGATVAGEADVQRLVAETLAGTLPPGASAAIEDAPPWWLCRLYTRLRGLPEADAVGRAVAEHALAKKGKELGVALMLFERYPTLFGLEDVLAFLAANPKAAAKNHALRPAEYRIQQSAPAFLAAVVSSGSPAAPIAADILHDVLLEGGKAPKPELLDAVASHDGEWLAGNAPAVLGGRHKLVGRLLDGLALTERWELVTVAGISLVGAGGDVADAALRWASDPGVAEQPAAMAIRGAAA